VQAVSVRLDRVELGRLGLQAAARPALLAVVPEHAAAAGRLQNLLGDYNRAGFDDQALYFLGESLWRLEQKDEARAAFLRLIQEESQSEWAPPAADRLGVVLVRTGPPKPKGPSTWERFKTGMGAIWDELGDTVRSYRLFN
jgi:hypothetical protein